MASCNPTDLLVAGKCFDCLSPGLKETIKLQLLCQIANGSGDSGITQLTGDVTAGPGSGSQVATIAAGAVTLAKMANIATNTVIGRSTAGTGAPEALTSITPASAAFSGTAGAGFVSLLTQSSVPAAPATGFALYADSSGRLSWRRATDGFTRSFDVTATANRTFTLPDASFTFAGQNLANTFSLAQVFSANGALSAPAVSFTGTPITGGTSATTKPMVLIETAGATSTAWSTLGTMLGINAPTGFTGNIIDAQLNGAARLTLTSSGNFTVSNGNITAGASLFAGGISQVAWTGRGILTSPAAGTVQLGAADAAAPVAQTLSVQSVVAGTSNTAGANWTLKGSAGTGSGAGGSIIFQVAPAGGAGSSQNAFSTILTLSGSSQTATFGGSVISGGSLQIPAASAFYWNARSVVRSPSDSVITLLNNAETSFDRLQFGGTTSSFPAIKRSTTTLQAVLADDSGFAAVQSLYDRFGSGTPEGSVTAPVGAVYHRTDGGASTSFYVKESGTGNTGWVAK